MADLPELPQRLVRLFALRWKDLIEKHGFTGGHLEWHQSNNKRSLAAYRPFSFAPPPLGSKVTHYGRKGEPISHEEWVRHRKEDHVTRQSDPAVIDSIGVAETITLAKERFEGCAGDYLPVWSSEAELDSDKFHESLERLQQSVMCEISDLWLDGEWHAAWFERKCRAKVADVLRLLVKEWAQKALKLEIGRLEGQTKPELLAFGPEMPHSGSQSYWDAFAEFKKNQQERLPNKQSFPVLPPHVLPAESGIEEACRTPGSPSESSPAQHITPDEPAGTPPGGEKKAPSLNITLIKDWMDDQGWTNETLAQQLKISERAISSMRNNGEYHGSDAVTKLANLMEMDIADIYEP